MPMRKWRPQYLDATIDTFRRRYIGLARAARADRMQGQSDTGSPEA